MNSREITYNKEQMQAVRKRLLTTETERDECAATARALRLELQKAETRWSDCRRELNQLAAGGKTIVHHRALELINAVTITPWPVSQGRLSELQMMAANTILGKL